MIRDEHEAIERVLTALRSAETPAGMERRVTAAVKERAAAGEAGSRRFRLARMLLYGEGEGVSGLRQMAFAATGLVVILTVVFAVARLERPERSDVRAARAGHSTQTGMAPALPEIAPDTAVSALPEQSAHGARVVRSGRMRMRSADERSGTVTSYPAPPAPLSAEEKTLLLVARTGGPQEIAMLDPVARAQQRAEDEAQFQRFTGQATKTDRE